MPAIPNCRKIKLLGNSFSRLCSQLSSKVVCKLMRWWSNFKMLSSPNNKCHFFIINLLLLQIFLFSGRKLIGSFCLTHLIVGRNLMPGSCHFGSLTKGQNYSASPDLPDVWKYLSAQINQQAIAVFLDLVLLGRYSIRAKAPPVFSEGNLPACYPAVFHYSWVSGILRQYPNPFPNVLDYCVWRGKRVTCVCMCVCICMRWPGSSWPLHVFDKRQCVLGALRCLFFPKRL